MSKSKKAATTKQLKTLAEIKKLLTLKLIQGKMSTRVKTIQQS